MSSIAFMNATLTTLSSQLEKFCSLLQQSKLIQADMFALPPVPADQEGKQVTEPVPVTHLRADDAARAMRTHIKSFYSKEGESRRIARRLPGLLAVQSADMQDLLDCAFNIEKEKHDFYNALKQLPGNAEERHELVHTAFPELITLNVTRQLIITQRPMQSVRFSWVHKHSMKRMSKDEVIKQLKNAIKLGSNKTLDQEAFIDKVEQEIIEIQRVPEGEELTIRRPLRVSPVANIRYEAKKRETASAHSPFILVSDKPFDPIAITPLGDYEPREHQVPDNYELVIPRLHLYRRLQPLKSVPS